MKLHKLFILTLLVLSLVGCENKSTNPNDYFAITINNAKKSYKTTDVLKISVQNKKNKDVQSVVYFLDDKNIGDPSSSTQSTINLSNKKMGERKISATIKTNNQEYTVTKTFVITASKAPKLLGYKILETYPHDDNAFTQGLEFYKDTLYEGTGQREKSTLRKTNYKTGEVLQSVPLAKNYFGEGITILNDKIYQLTWQANTGLIYNAETLEQTGTFVYNKSKEGWGLCNDGTTIYKSDGTEKIWRLDPNTLAEQDYIEIYTHNKKIDRVNELEWVEGKIFANVWEKDAIAIVNPNTGAVEGVIGLTDLKKEVTQKAQNDVLNGIAYKGEPNIIYVTGKNWDKMFKLEILQHK